MIIYVYVAFRQYAGMSYFYFLYSRKRSILRLKITLKNYFRWSFLIYTKKAKKRGLKKRNEGIKNKTGFFSPFVWGLRGFTPFIKNLLACESFFFFSFSFFLFF
jgi:hypothetical protein